MSLQAPVLRQPGSPVDPLFPARWSPRAFSEAPVTAGQVEVLLEAGAILAIPTTPFTAPPLGLPLSELDRYSARIGLLCSFAGLCGLPQINLPLVKVGGKPAGLSLIAWRGADARLVAIAQALEAAA